MLVVRNRALRNSRQWEASFSREEDDRKKVHYGVLYDVKGDDLPLPLFAFWFDPSA